MATRHVGGREPTGVSHPGAHGGTGWRSTSPSHNGKCSRPTTSPTRTPSLDASQKFEERSNQSARPFRPTRPRCVISRRWIEQSPPRSQSMTGPLRRRISPNVRVTTERAGHQSCLPYATGGVRIVRQERATAEWGRIRSPHPTRCSPVRGRDGSRGATAPVVSHAGGGPIDDTLRS
jgi:hypothetical protein